jgi:hypothetical protein
MLRVDFLLGSERLIDSDHQSIAKQTVDGMALPLFADLLSLFARPGDLSTHKADSNAEHSHSRGEF